VDNIEILKFILLVN